MKTDVKVGDIMGRGVVTTNPNASVKEACELMTKHDIGGITVVDKGKISGIMTQGDVVNIVANGQNPNKIKIKEVMSKDITVISPDVDLGEAAKVMVEAKVKRLPVVREGRLIGVITQADIVKISPSIYDLIYEKAKLAESPVIESTIELTGECEECGNYSQYLRNVDGTLMCEDCYADVKEEG